MANQTHTKKEYEKLGKMLVDLQESGVKPGKTYYRAAFIKGIITGFGGVIGATILVGLLLWVLSFFNSVPIIDKFVDTVQNGTN